MSNESLREIVASEVQLVYATLGTGMLLAGKPLLGPEMYAAIVAVVVLATLVAPPRLRMRLLRE